EARVPLARDAHLSGEERRRVAQLPGEEADERRRLHPERRARVRREAGLDEHAAALEAHPPPRAAGPAELDVDGAVEALELVRRPGGREPAAARAREEAEHAEEERHARVRPPARDELPEAAERGPRVVAARRPAELAPELLRRPA